MNQYRQEQGVAKTVALKKPDGRLAFEPYVKPGAHRVFACPTFIHADRRTRADRRALHNRRQLIRFEDDRRAIKARRLGEAPWAIA